MKQTLTDIAKVLVDHPENVTVVETEDEEGVILTLSVAEGDMGKVIGRHGKIAKAIRTVMKSAANKDGRRVTVDIE
ncbi:MAG: KH domain-containing protein [Clostridia bacterium]|nr:KH domain-containing protein [Clostridia bacterium]